jgi:predicted O-linked N-acetylglucosamine transferase (SPINDLY family)
MIYVPGSWLITEPPVGALEQRGTATQANNTLFAMQRKELREQYQIPIDSFVYGNFGRVWKLNDLVFRVWMSTIERVPGSFLVMLDDQDGYGLGDPIPRIRKAWKDFGLAEYRLVILPPFRRGEHIDALRALLDVALDSVSYSGGATSYDALFAGVPLVASPGGDKMTQRSAGSVLTAAGLDLLLVGKDLHEYQDIAVRLGLDEDFFTRTKDHIVNATKTSILFNPQIGVNAMIAGLRKAYELWYQGHEPQTIMTDTLAEPSVQQGPGIARDDAGHEHHGIEL